MVEVRGSPYLNREVPLHAACSLSVGPTRKLPQADRSVDDTPPLRSEIRYYSMTITVNTELTLRSCQTSCSGAIFSNPSMLSVQHVSTGGMVAVTGPGTSSVFGSGSAV